MGNGNIQKLQEICGKIKQKEKRVLPQFTNLMFQGLKSHPYLNLQNCKTISEELFQNLQQAKANSFIYQKVVKKDRRSIIQNTNVYPYSAIGLLSWEGRQGINMRGTAFLIGIDLLLTCAHNCYDVNNKYKFDKKTMCFYPALNGQIGQPYKIKEVFSHEGFRSQKDFAVLQLQKCIGDKYGYFGLDFSKHIPKKAMIYGYPLKIQGKSSKLMMCGDQGQIEQKDSFLNYQISTSQGQSGSPIFYQYNGKWYAKGIHVQGGNLFNRGIFLAPIKEDLQNMTLDYVVTMNLCKKLEKNQIYELFFITEPSIKLDVQKKLEDISILDLSKNKLQKVPEIFFKSNFLSELDLSQNCLKHLPTEIDNFRRLTKLSISKNNLVELPSSLRDVRLLSHLYIGYNDFTVFPPVICQLEQLTTLQIQTCRIQQIPNKIANLQNLTTLFCGENIINKIPCFSKKMYIAHLGLSKNKIDCLPSNKEEIGLFQSVERLYLQENQIKEIPLLITLMQKIKQVNLRGNLISQVDQSYFNKDVKIGLDKNPLNASGVSLIYQLKKRQFPISY